MTERLVGDFQSAGIPLLGADVYQVGEPPPRLEMQRQQIVDIEVLFALAGKDGAYDALARRCAQS
jgi:hypothetical protein